MSKYNLIPIEFIEPGPWQPRKDFDKIELEALAKSIKNQGVIQPIIVKKKKDTKNHYHLIAGERRWRASQIAKIHENPNLLKQIFTSYYSRKFAPKNKQKIGTYHYYSCCFCITISTQTTHNTPRDQSSFHYGFTLSTLNYGDQSRAAGLYPCTKHYIIQFPHRIAT